MFIGGALALLLRVLMILAAIAIVVFSIVMIVTLIRSWLQNSRAPANQVRAVVARKRFIDIPLTRLVTFRIAGNGEIELVVPEEIFLSLDSGQLGELAFKGERFQGFIPEPEEPARMPPPPPRPLNPL